MPIHSHFQCRGEEILRVEALDHVQLAMPPGGEPAARHFYSDVLAIPEIQKPAHLAKRGGCWFERGALKVHLGVEQNFHPAGKAHPAFTVSNLAELTKRLKAEGFAVIADEPLAGYERCYVNDPFGNRIELLEPLVDRPT